LRGIARVFLRRRERERERERERDRRGLRNTVVGQGCKEWGEGIGPRSDRLLAFR
jgi:hypothetical protein